MTSPSIEARLREVGPRLAARAQGEMYDNPFWSARFGERGRQHAHNDGAYHIDYLLEALAADSAVVMERYARWLREVLVARGMCSRHLAENLERLRAAIAELGYADGERATALLGAAVESLTHRQGDAGAIDGLRRGLARATARKLRDDDLVPADGATEAALLEDLEDLLSFLSDALAFDAVERLCAHVRFLATVDAQRAVPKERVGEVLAALSHVLQTTMPNLSSAPSQQLAAAREAIACGDPHE